ncbi:MAG: bifunctional diaminohydroxyphosphoribosylaminopyrimidine deaminase/5-amino-6-(5-phosphoribosylamino)uracil reductase RibD [Planctomyces sp.]
MTDSASQNVPVPGSVRFQNDLEAMRFAIQLAENGAGLVEPNPMVGALIVSPDGTLLSAGYHRRYGAPHAEVDAIQNLQHPARGNDLYVTLEPCCHTGKTPPCTDAVIAAGFRRVIVGCEDPSEKVRGKGIQQLQNAGMNPIVGICKEESQRLIAPFRMLHCQKRPWIHAKWAMTIDGRIASSTGHSKWISGPHSRRYAHELRGRMDAIITGAGTVRHDDPALTARPPGHRKAIRVVLDAAGLSVTRESALVRTLPDAPLMIFVTAAASQDTVNRLRDLGAEVIQTTIAEVSTGTLAAEIQETNRIPVTSVVAELGRRQCTHVLLEAGPGILGAFSDADLIDELHVFAAPILLGGQQAFPPVGGKGRPQIPSPRNLRRCRWTPIGDDLLCEADVIHHDVQR